MRFRLSMLYIVTGRVSQENGIFDALEKGYLRSFIFAIYLVRPFLSLVSFEEESDSHTGQ